MNIRVCCGGYFFVFVWKTTSNANPIICLTFPLPEPHFRPSSGVWHYQAQCSNGGRPEIVALK